MITVRLWAFAAILVVFAAGQMPRGQGQPSTGRAVGWVGLFDDDLVSWLENENRLASLCSGVAADTGPWYSCRDEKLSPKVRVARLRDAPSDQTSHRGDLVVVALPGKGLQSFYVNVSGGAAAAFSPDLVDGDWGYGPYFHETVVERRDTWVRLPEGPFPQRAWLNMSELSSEPNLLWLDAGSIVTSPLGDLFIIAIENGAVRAREEQQRDMWCEAEPRPPLEPFKELRLGTDALYTATGHLTLRIKYTRGC
jgi:hypothetical protein